MPFGAMAQDGHIKFSADNFVVEGRKFVVKGGDAQTKEYLQEKFYYQGGKVAVDLISELFAPSVAMKHCKDIEGHKDAYSINVSKNTAIIKYTSQEMLDMAIEVFEDFFDKSYSGYIIRGGSAIFYADDARNLAGQIRSNSSGVYDGVTKKQSMKHIRSAMRSQLTRSDKFIFAMVSKDYFRVNFNVFNGINPTLGTICDKNSYTLSEIKTISAEARARGGEFVPAIDLLSDNKLFEQYTGHAMNSVEGMRFVRAMIEQCATEWGVKSICIGKLRDFELSDRYIEFITDIAARNSLEIIIL